MFHISDMHFQITLTSDHVGCGRIWFSSVQRPRRLADEKKKEEEETLVKYKSADILCREA